MFLSLSLKENRKAHNCLFNSFQICLILFHFVFIPEKTSPSTSAGTKDEKTPSFNSSTRLLSPKNARVPSSALSEDESGSDRLSISDEDDIFADEEENKTLDKEKLSHNKQNNTNVQATSKREEEMLKSSKLTPDQIREIKEAFHVFDNNGDGCITATELKKLVTSLGYNITEAELMDMMNQIGENVIAVESSSVLHTQQALKGIVDLGTRALSPSKS